MNTNVIEPITAKGMETETQEGDITVGKVYTFRKLNSTDTFLMFKILGKIGINEFSNALGKDTVKQLISGAKGGDTTAVGLAVVLEVLSLLAILLFIGRNAAQILGLVMICMVIQAIAVCGSGLLILLLTTVNYDKDGRLRK